MNVTLNVLKFCAEEVERQQDMPMSVYDMYRAWSMTQRLVEIGQCSSAWITSHIVAVIGAMVKDCNATGFRTSEVGFLGGGSAANSEDVRDKMLDFCVHWPSMTPQEAFDEFEWIHPFVDGNGRVGQILANLKAETLDAPTHYKYQHRSQ